MHSLGTCLNVVYDHPGQLSGVGSRWSAGLPFWGCEILTNASKSMNNSRAIVSQRNQPERWRPVVRKSLAAKKHRVSACIFSWLLRFGRHNSYEESNCYCDNVFHRCAPALGDTMSLYWLCYRHNNQISIVIEPGAERGWPVNARLC